MNKKVKCLVDILGTIISQASNEDIIKIILTAKKMTVKDLASATGRSERSIRDWIHYRPGIITPKTAQALQDSLGIPTWIWTYEQEKQCIVCNTKFKYQDNRVKFCSDICRVNKIKSYVNKKYESEIKCGFCGNSFVAEKRQQRYCSASCRVNKMRERAKDYKHKLKETKCKCGIAFYGSKKKLCPVFRKGN